MFTAGGELNLTDLLTLTFGVLATTYVEEKYTDSTTGLEMNLDKTIVNACLSVSCRL